MVEWTSGVVLNLAGSLATLGLGILVLAVRPVRAPQVALGIFALTLGVGNALFSLGLADTTPGAEGMPGQLPWLLFHRALLIAFSGALVVFTLIQPWLPRRGEWIDVAWAAAAALAGAAAYAILAGDRVAPIYLGPTAFMVVLMARRHLRAPDADAELRRHLTLFPAGAAAQYYILGVGSVGAGPGALSALVVFVAVSSGAWAVSSVRPRGPASREARGSTLLFPASALLGVFGSALAGGAAAYDRAFGIVALPQAWVTGVLVYAILRHRFAGIDVKLRWTISRSTVAAAFVAVFFVASEGAQILFGRNNEWIGLIAAGGLVFAIAPLQRAAERLAEKAVPPDVAGQITGSEKGVDAEDTFRRALRLALRDRTLTRDEERELFVIATRLGIRPERAFELQGEMERGNVDARTEVR